MEKSRDEPKKKRNRPKGLIYRKYASESRKNKKLYHVWCSMRHRCTMKSDTNYYKYGARGIQVCSEWENWDNFYNWSMNNGYADGLSIDRIDSSGNYCPENCRWTDKITQANNTRRNRMITYNGKTQTLAEWCRELDLDYHTISSRIHNHSQKWSIDKILSTSTCKPFTGTKRKKEV